MEIDVLAAVFVAVCLQMVAVCLQVAVFLTAPGQAGGSLLADSAVVSPVLASSEQVLRR